MEVRLPVGGKVEQRHERKGGRRRGKRELLGAGSRGIKWGKGLLIYVGGRRTEGKREKRMILGWRRKFFYPEKMGRLIQEKGKRAGGTPSRGDFSKYGRRDFITSREREGSARIIIL